MVCTQQSCWGDGRCQALQGPAPIYMPRGRTHCGLSLTHSSLGGAASPGQPHRPEEEQESARCHLPMLFVCKISGCCCPAPRLPALQCLRKRRLCWEFSVHTRYLFILCSTDCAACSVRAASFREHPFPHSPPWGRSFCCKPPPIHQSFPWGSEMSPSTTHCLIKNGSCVATKPGERLVSPACSSLPAPPASISSGYSSGRESGDFVIPPAREACGGAKFCPARAGR